MVIGPINHDDFTLCLMQGASGCQPAESPAHDHHRAPGIHVPYISYEVILSEDVPACCIIHEGG